MNKFGVGYFHNVCLNYFQNEKLEDVKNICKIETTMEKWFQCEIVLSFVQERYEVLSNEIYNEKYGSLKEEWDSYKGDWEKIVAEASVYKNSSQKADIVIEKDDESLVCEIKLIWMYDEVCRSKEQFEIILNRVLQNNEIFDDAKKMKELAQPFAHRCLTIFASIDEKSFPNGNIDMKEIVKSCLEKEGYKLKNIFSNKIGTYDTDYSQFYDDHKYKYEIFIINIELGA
jgi:hypothetical protein